MKSGVTRHPSSASRRSAPVERQGWKFQAEQRRDANAVDTKVQALRKEFPSKMADLEKRLKATERPGAGR